MFAKTPQGIEEAEVVEKDLATLELRRERDVVILAISGEFDLSCSDSLDEMREEALATGLPVVIDLTRCEFIDSHGLAGIIRAFNQSTDAGLPFALAGSGPQVRRVLEVAGLTVVLPYFRELEDAVQHVRSTPRGPLRDHGAAAHPLTDHS